MAAALSPPQPFEQPAVPYSHVVQLYGSDKRLLAKSVCRYLHEGLLQDEALLVIATAEHREAFTQELNLVGAQPQTAAEEGRLLFLDSEDTLANLLVDGEPDWDRFESVIGDAIRKIRPHDGIRIRAYGDMVGVLWNAGRVPAAVRLEEFWNRLLQSDGFKLFCAYGIDVFGEEFDSPGVQDLLCAHSHVIPSSDKGEVESALRRAMGEILGPEFESPVKVLTNGNGSSSWPSMAGGEADILSLRSNFPAYAQEVLARARRHYEGEKRFRALIENSSDAISLLDSDGNVLYASASSKRVLGYPPDELVGRSGFELIHPDDAGRAERVFAEAIASPRFPVQFQARIRQKHGSWCWVENTLSNLLDDPDIRAIVSNCRDIDERKTAEEERQRHAEELARSNSELQAFAFAAAHDLKEPLRTVSAFTQLLTQHCQLDKSGQQFAAFIVDGVKRMSGLLDDLLSFTSLSFDAPWQRVDLEHAAKQAIQNLEHAISESKASIRIDPLPAVQGSESHIVELFQNLIGNAIKYRGEAPLEIRIDASEIAHQCVVRVKDNGIGIAPEYRDYVFGIFKRLHGHEIAGTGIGLAICKKIVEGFGGRIWVESELGSGSTFSFTVTPAELDGHQLASPCKTTTSSVA